jgi:hypothetical protein
MWVEEEICGNGELKYKVSKEDSPVVSQNKKKPILYAAILLMSRCRAVCGSKAKKNKMLANEDTRKEDHNTAMIFCALGTVNTGELGILKSPW